MDRVMKILLVSDDESPYLWDYFQPEKFKDIDLIISCGDLKAEYLSFLVTMINAPLFYVHGNHDAKYKVKPPEGCECIDGKIIKYKDIRILGLGGSHRYNSNEYQYSEKEMRKRIRKLKPRIWFNKGFDILVTHAPSFSLSDNSDECHRGFNCFDDLLDKYSPKYLLHGHVHLNYGIKERRLSRNNTEVINGYQYYILEY
jgi:Icc-related predicted phosphoesterase